MIQGIIIYSLVGYIYTKNVHDDRIRKELHHSDIWKLYLIIIACYPILMLEDFYYWNFIECNQYGNKTEV